MSLDANQLYALLPAIYRTRDAQNGGPLKALASVLAEQGAILEENIHQLYDDHFIETCAPWVIPYIGDLIGSNPIYEISAAPRGTRAEVANTIGYRRRKGTLLALEQVAMDVSGRPAAAVEFFKRLITTESMHHIRPRHAACPDLRRGLELEGINTAFDTLNRTVDVRRIAPRARTIADPDPTPLDANLHGGGRFNIPDVGIYLWRWKAFKVVKAPAFRVDDRRYLFSPLGQDMPLFNALAPRDSFSRLTTRFDVSQPTRRREFHANLQSFYGPTNSVAIYADGALIDASGICCGDLRDYGGSWGCTTAGKITIDPMLGRIRLGAGVPVPKELRVTYCYGFPAEMGGGPYDRSRDLPALKPSQFNLVAVVGSAEAPTLEAAVASWNAQPPGSQGLIVLPGVQVLTTDLTGAAAIRLPAQSQLWVVSAEVNPLGSDNFTYKDSLTTVRGNIDIQGQQGSSSGATQPAGQLFVSGLWISGSIRILGDAANVQLMDCTVVPGISLERNGAASKPGAPSITASAADTNLSLIRSITGPVGVSVGGTTRICTSIIDSGARWNVAYAADDFSSAGADLHIEDSTVIGKVRVRTMELGSNTIFLACLPRHDPWSAALWCSRQQSGCMRFCFLPAAAIAPRRFRCLPDTAGQEGALEPKFVALRYGHPSYGLLSGDTPMAVWTGGDNGSQIGVYNPLQETEAVRNVQLRAAEYLPFALEAGVFLEPSRTDLVTPPRFVYGYGWTPSNPCVHVEFDDLRFVGVGATLI